MKYLRYLVVFALFLCIDTSHVEALSCSTSVSKELGQYATYVKADYEVIDNSETKELQVGEDTTTYKVPNFTFEISIYNITKDLYVVVSDDITERRFTVTNDMTTDGVYTFTNTDFGTVYTYTIIIYSANDGCYGEKIRTVNLVKPRYNAYSEYTYCQNSSNLYCQKFTRYDLGIKTVSDFLTKIQVNNELNNPDRDEIEENKTLSELFKKNWKIYLGIFAGAIIITIGVIVFIKKRNKKKGWKL